MYHNIKQSFLKIKSNCQPWRNWDWRRWWKWRRRRRWRKR